HARHIRNVPRISPGAQLLNRLIELSEVERIVIEEPLVVQQYIAMLERKEHRQFNTSVREGVGQPSKSWRVPGSEFCYRVIRIVNVGDVAILVAIQGVSVRRIYTGPFNHGKRAKGKAFAKSCLTSGIGFKVQLYYLVTIERDVYVSRPC